ncbi:ferritin-like domain-containing protein [Bradyrhizobium quebecense]|uniref:Ferritin-like protein n=2 Tax=Bradyrhizobium quebecense TaxID=2748629 RepID=A0ABS3MG61_9BRAD|nr:ferritin-like protein [Bradyrhizobium quebecense]UGY05699.1 ferritin-like protein [Bradyrhizobium quebecense]
MNTIAEFVSSGIHTHSELKRALQLAMQLEFSTIPPYLCAQWSIREDPDRVEGILHKVVSQEMIHFALVGNLLTAVGGMPKIANKSFLPKYPLRRLPGDVPQALPVGLRPLTKSQLAVLMQIEYPEFPPIAVLTRNRPATIGAFYTTIEEAFHRLNPPLDPAASWVQVPFAKQILTVTDAIASIDRIKSEGEGLEDSPEEPSPAHNLAHYYLFKEVHVGRRLIRVDGNWKFEGAPISMPEVFSFRRCIGHRKDRAHFRIVLSQLLTHLEHCWSSGRTVDVPAMFEVKLAGRALVERGIRPEFVWMDHS